MLASLVAQRLKHLPAVQETQVWSLGQEDPLEKEMATHSSILAWRIPWMEEPGGYSPQGCKESDMTEWLLFLSFFLNKKKKNWGLPWWSGGSDSVFRFCRVHGLYPRWGNKDSAFWMRVQKKLRRVQNKNSESSSGKNCFKKTEQLYREISLQHKLLQYEL